MGLPSGGLPIDGGKHMGDVVFSFLFLGSIWVVLQGGKILDVLCGCPQGKWNDRLVKARDCQDVGVKSGHGSGCAELVGVSSWGPSCGVWLRQYVCELAWQAGTCWSG